MTGATGTIGGELAARLLAAGHSIIALTRQGQDITANDGQPVAASNFHGTMPEPGRLARLSGDICQPGLGLNKDELALLERYVDLVVHCAAVTDFNTGDNVYQSVNVDGVAHMLAICRNARFLHVSTAYVCGIRGGLIAEEPAAVQQEFTNGYERSKAAGEALVLAANRESVVARPSIVVGAHADGAYPRFDSFYKFFRLLAEGHISRLPVAEHATLDFVPIDHVIAGLLDIIHHWERAEGTIIHLTAARAIPVSLLVDAIGQFDHLDPPSLVPLDRFTVDNLPPLERRLYKQFAAFYTAYLQRDPQFETENLRRVNGRVCPAMDLAALQRMIRYSIDQGFIRKQRAEYGG
ncbi:MAG: SDR family oxidoreductase [Parasphingorhabdus sp.]|uniref:SDR family oxidoreductase n=1 Tax=Parasphingorhabdus sp. TaxID=2709688 RepID=UPI0032987D63